MPSTAPSSSTTPPFDSYAHQLARNYTSVWESLPKDKSKWEAAEQGKFGSFFKSGWNPTRHGRLLQSLPLPWKMLLDCISDPRNFVYEDILHCTPHKDPLIEKFLVYIRCKLMAHVDEQWRSFYCGHEQDRNVLAYCLDELADLHKTGKIKPFAPIGVFLGKWAKWRKLCEERGEAQVKHKRPEQWLGSSGFLKRARSELEYMLINHVGFRTYSTHDVNMMLQAADMVVNNGVKERGISAFCG